MATTRSLLDNFYESRQPYLEEIIGKMFKDRPPIIENILNVKSAKSGWVDYATVSGLGLFAAKDEGEDAQQDRVLQGPTARTRIITYALRNDVTQEAIEDDQGDGIITARMPDMVRSGKATVEVLGHDLLNGAFDSITTPDGAYLVSNSHVLLDGSAGDNLITDDFDQEGLQTAVTLMKNQTDDRGIPIMQTPKTLIVHPDDEWAARVVLETAGVTGSDHNDINPMSSQGINLVVSPYLTSSDAWFLLSDDHKLNWFWRMRPSNWSEVDNVKGVVEIGMRFRGAANATDWRGIVGSNGTV